MRDSIDSFDNFNTTNLARRLEASELLEFRRLAAHLYKKTKRWEESISLSKRDKLFKDAIITAGVSASVEVAEELLSYFVDIGNKECFAATLYLCFDLLRPDIISELSWQHGLNDFYMPYNIQSQRRTLERVRTFACKVLIGRNVAKLVFSVGHIGERGPRALREGQAAGEAGRRGTNHYTWHGRPTNDYSGQWVRSLASRSSTSV